LGSPPWPSLTPPPRRVSFAVPFEPLAGPCTTLTAFKNLRTLRFIPAVIPSCCLLFLLVHSFAPPLFSPAFFPSGFFANIFVFSGTPAPFLAFDPNLLGHLIPVPFFFFFSWDPIRNSHPQLLFRRLPFSPLYFHLPPPLSSVFLSFSSFFDGSVFRTRKITSNLFFWIPVKVPAFHLFFLFPLPPVPFSFHREFRSTFAVLLLTFTSLVFLLCFPFFFYIGSTLIFPPDRARGNLGLFWVPFISPFVFPP